MGLYNRLAFYSNVINEAEIHLLNKFQFYLNIIYHNRWKIFLTGGHYKWNPKYLYGAQFYNPLTMASPYFVEAIMLM